MNIIVCADNRMGISFNGKRPTRDHIILTEILTKYGHDIWIFPNSEKYVRSEVEKYDIPVELHVINDEAEIDDLPTDATIFIETGTNEFFDMLLDKVDNIILYQWNTTYMYTEQFPDIHADTRFSMVHQETIQGSSHDEVIIQFFEKNIPTKSEPVLEHTEPKEESSDELIFLDDDHRELYRTEMARLTKMQYEQTGRKLSKNMIAPMFIMTGMPFLYHRLQEYIPSKKYPYPDFIDFTAMRENLRISRGEEIMINLAENLYNGQSESNIYRILGYCDRTMCRLAKLAIDMVFEQSVNTKI